MPPTAQRLSTEKELGFAELTNGRVAVQLAERMSSVVRADVTDPEVVLACGPVSHFKTGFGLLVEWTSFDDTVPAKVAS